MQSKFFIFIILLIVATLSAACGKKGAPVAEKSAVTITAPTETVQLSSTQDFYEAVGTVRARTSTVVAAQVTGRIIALRAREGDFVRAGQTLVEIDNREAQTHIQKAQAGLREAQTSVDQVDKNIRVAEAAKNAAEVNKNFAATTLKRYQALLERKSVSPQEFDEVQSRYKLASAEAERADKMVQMLTAQKNMTFTKIDQAKADVSGAQIFSGYARIAAPISGIVTIKHTEIGSLAAPGAPLLTIEDHNYRLEASVEESQLRNIRQGSTAIVTIDALGQEEMSGRIVEIVPGADPASRSYTVKIEVPAKTLLRTGLFGRARFVAGTRDVLSIPAKAIMQRGQLNYVYVVEGGIARMRLVTLGKNIGDRVEALSGLSANERIVVDSSLVPAEGVKVQ